MSKENPILTEENQTQIIVRNRLTKPILTENHPTKNWQLTTDNSKLYTIFAPKSVSKTGFIAFFPC